MAQLTTDKITEIYCIADDFCKEFSKEIKKHQILPDDGKRHRNRSFAMSDAEIITIMICFHYGSFRNLKHFYLFYSHGFAGFSIVSLSEMAMFSSSLSR
jgi:hypothetical protein